MENASKALLMAGAVLITILVISLGVAIFMMARGGTRGTALTDEERNTFNNQFLSYVDQELLGREVKIVIQKIISSNKNHDETKQIRLKKDGTEFTEPNGLSEQAKNITNNTLYQINIHFDENGLVEVIEII